MSRLGRLKHVKKLLAGMSPWIPLFAFVCLFHIVRGVASDAILFGLFTLLEIASWRGWLPRFKHRPNLNLWLVRGVLVGAGMTLFFAQRDSLADHILFLALLPLAIWAVDFKHAPIRSPKFVMHTRWLWLTLALTMALVELGAYIAANILKDDRNWPTVSVLVGPVLEAPFGRLVFVAIWVAIGWGMLRSMASLRKGAEQ